MPLGVTTETFTAPVEPGGVVALIKVLVTLLMVAAVPPKVTLVAPARFVPVIFTNVPPVVGPDAGEMPVMVGTMYVYEIVAEPPGVVTVILTVPAEPAGEVALREVALFTVNVVACELPNITAVAPVNDVPVITTDVPPAIGPLVGEMLDIVGAAA